jgi:BirA family biotin operon repressor/biotin-[acetyl-CoA-carboxylase] ligase
VIAWRIETYESLASTSDFCVERAKAGEQEGLAVLGLTQTAGRGSRGREWQAPEGNLNLSVLLRPDVKPRDAGIYPLLAGVAVAEALGSFVSTEIRPTLKWPNDVLIGQAKIAGVLIDAAPAQDRIEWLVMGIGINLRRAPVIEGRLTTALSDQGGNLDAHNAAGAVLESLSRWLAVHARSGGAAIRDAWLKRAHAIGTAIEVRSGSGSTNGTFAGISETGALLLARAGDIQRIDTGEILLGRAAV